MNYEDIKMFHERCADKFCVIRLSMTTNMLMDEIEELRTYIEETKLNNMVDKFIENPECFEAKL